MTSVFSPPPLPSMLSHYSWHVSGSPGFCHLFLTKFNLGIEKRWLCLCFCHLVPAQQPVGISEEGILGSDLGKGELEPKIQSWLDFPEIDEHFFPCDPLEMKKRSPAGCYNTNCI